MNEQNSIIRYIVQVKSVFKNEKNDWLDRESYLLKDGAFNRASYYQTVNQNIRIIKRTIIEEKITK